MVILFGNGKLGKACYKYFSSKEVSLVWWTRNNIDLSQITYSQLVEQINTIGGGYFINTTAYTDVNQAEYARDLAYKVNASGVLKIAQACSVTNKHLIHVSTDYVFDGQKDMSQAYVESDITNPINWYGQTKLVGEEYIKDSGCSYSIVRTTRLYDDDSGLIPGLMEKIKSTKEPISAANDQKITPTHADDLAKQIYIIYRNKLQGTLHAAAKDPVTPYDLITYLAKEMKVDTDIWETAAFYIFKNQASRPKNCILKNQKLQDLGLDVMKTWAASIKWK